MIAEKTQGEPEASEMAQKLMVHPIEQIPAYIVSQFNNMDISHTHGCFQRSVIECTATNHVIFSCCIYTSFHGNLFPWAWIWYVTPPKTCPEWLRYQWLRGQPVGWAHIWDSIQSSCHRACRKFPSCTLPCRLHRGPHLAQIMRFTWYKNQNHSFGVKCCVCLFRVDDQI